MSTVAAIPVKRFASAKRRLEPALGAAAREGLSEAMLGDVLDAIGRCAALDAVSVVTGERRAVELARSAGATVIPDPTDGGHSRAALRGIAWAQERGAERAVLLPGDCPLLDPVELDAILHARAAPGVAVVPDRHGTGTNALVLSPPDAIGPAFGPGSCQRHRLLAERAGAACSVRRMESLALDVDTPDDLAVLRALLEREAGRAPRTAAALTQATISDR